ncbi:MAG: hypothetical protein ACOH1T_02110 [Microbacteriaceae bacterium]
MSALPRFGDPSARRARVYTSRSLAVVHVVYLITAVGFGIAAAHSFANSNLRSAWFAVAVVVMIFASLAGLWVALRIFWKPALDASKQLQLKYPSAIVIAASLPSARQEILGKVWPHHYAPLPWRVVVIADEYGVSLWSLTSTDSALVFFAWGDVTQVLAAEYVELGLAHSSLAFVAKAPDLAFPLYLVRPGLAVVAPIHGEELVSVAAAIESRRPLG